MKTAGYVFCVYIGLRIYLYLFLTYLLLKKDLNFILMKFTLGIFLKYSYKLGDFHPDNLIEDILI